MNIVVILYFSLASSFLTYIILRFFWSKRQVKSFDPEIINMLKRMTPKNEEPSESMFLAIKNATIFPFDFFEEEKNQEKKTGTEKTISQRREELERFFLKNPNHPLRPEKINYFLFILEGILSDPGSEIKVYEIEKFLDSESDFLENLKKSLIIPSQCEDELRLVENLLKRTLGIGYELDNVVDFLSRFPSHPLRSEVIVEMIERLSKIKRREGDNKQNTQLLLRVLDRKWDSNSYFISGNLIFQAFSSSKQEVLDSQKT
uniref:Uncharacterized protein n=1 Tax=candidate division CPR3 bacterium TaxID=2268181 RepID=A0A7C4R5X1_UNCC3